MKKVISFILALLMVMSLCVTAFADDTTGHTITIKNDVSGHTYSAYCIFEGDLNNNVLSDIVWGKGVKSAELLAALQGYVSANKGTDNEVKPFAGKTTAAEVAEVLVTFADDPTNLDAIAKIIGENLSTTVAGTSTASDTTSIITGLADGYYLVKDSGTIPVTSTATKYILKVVGDVEVTAKDEVVESDKAIQKANGATFDLVHQDDYNVGDTINFQITGDIPNMEGYETYTYIARDTMSSGITPVDVAENDGKGDGKIDVTVQVVTLDASKKVTATHKTLDSTEYTFVENKEGESYTFSLSINDFINYKSQEYAGKSILITYAGVLNEGALITKSETNESFIEFSNNPYNNDTGKTTTTKVYVFDFDINIDKYTGTDAETGTKLDGAKFVMYKLIPNTNTAEGQPATVPVFYKWNESADKVEWVSVEGYAPNSTENYVTEAVRSAVKAGTITEVTTANGGAAKFQGLDTGDYYLLETEAPSGYNTLATYVKVTLTATYNDDGTIKEKSENITIPTSGQPYAKQPVKNNAGATLPSTGGIGTTIFYVLGITLMLGAAVLMITKRRVAE